MQKFVSTVSAAYAAGKISDAELELLATEAGFGLALKVIKDELTPWSNRPLVTTQLPIFVDESFDKLVPLGEVYIPKSKEPKASEESPINDDHEDGYGNIWERLPGKVHTAAEARYLVYGLVNRQILVNGKPLEINRTPGYYIYYIKVEGEILINLYPCAAGDDHSTFLNYWYVDADLEEKNNLMDHSIILSLED